MADAIVSWSGLRSRMADRPLSLAQVVERFRTTGTDQFSNVGLPRGNSGTNSLPKTTKTRERTTRSVQARTGAQTSRPATRRFLPPLAARSRLAATSLDGAEANGPTRQAGGRLR